MMNDMIKDIAATIIEGFNAYRARFDALTARAEDRFRQADWQGMQQDAAERLDTYQQRLETVVDDIADRFSPAARTPAVWEKAKIRYAPMADAAADTDLAQTFFNSVSRRMLRATGVDAVLEFVHHDPPLLAPIREDRDIETYRFGGNDYASVLLDVLEMSRLGPDLHDTARDARRLGQAMARKYTGNAPPRTLAVLKTVFYRGTGAYLIGRLTMTDGVTLPWGAAFVNRGGRMMADGVITDARGIRILFSFTHAYFLAATDNLGGLIGFLQELLPNRRRAELYISLGYNRHGKTELYRDLTQHQNACRDIFVRSPGQLGMVMVVFNMPSDNLVFKVIRDAFAEPKRTTRLEVIAKYDYIFRHDRTGRLPDAQSFEQLTFNRGCFHPDVIDELLRTAARAVTVDGDDIVLERVYVERRVTPLDVFLKTAADPDARAAVVDFGQAVKDMAASDIFPGDLLIKNFGVTELGRVIFYDYDEVCPLSSCRFRAKPAAMHYEHELDSAPWFMVADNDVFPEEFPAFLGLSADLLGVLLEHHGDLFTPEFWQDHQQRIASGNPKHVIPYQTLDEE
jgi:isocitrate dehydrogenase kinase/phosphatase